MPLIDDESGLIPQNTIGGGNNAGIPGTTIEKPTDETRVSNITIAVDADLYFAGLANTKYRVEGKIFYYANTLGGFRAGIMGPASPILVSSIHRNYGPLQSSVADHVGAAFDTVGQAMAGGTGYGIHEFISYIELGETAGNIGFGWAQNTLFATGTKILAGSYLAYKALTS